MSAKTKIALVTGGSRGLGKNMAIKIAAKGIDVILTYRSNEDEANKTVKEIENIGQKAAALYLDMKAFNSLDRFVQQVMGALETKWNITSLDFLVNNAVMGATVHFEQVTEELFTDFLNVHFKGIYFLTQI